MKRPVVMAHKRTREIIKRYESVTEAAEDFGFSHFKMSKLCRRRSLSGSFWYVRFEDEFDPDEDFTGKPHCPAVLIEVETKRALWFPTRYAAADFLGVDRSYIGAAIRLGRTIDYRFRVASAGRRIK